MVGKMYWMIAPVWHLYRMGRRIVYKEKNFVGEFVLLGIIFNEPGEGLKLGTDWRSLKQG